MRFKFVLTIAVIVAMTGTVRAGVYCSLDQLPYPVPKTFKSLNDSLANVRSPLNITENQDQRHKLYLKHQEALVAKERTGDLTVDDRIELSGLYIRLNEPKEAIKVLQPVEDQQHFLVMTHLATAYQQLNESSLEERIRSYQRAISYQQRAIRLWPTVSLRWNLDQLTWYRRAEQYYLLLLTLRLHEIEGRKQSPDTVDALFPRLRLDGAFEVGGPPQRSTMPAEDAPPDALAIVGQLVYWLPFDNRLFWLYGELLNQHSDAIGAYEALGEIVRVRKDRVPPILDHYRQLEKGADERKLLQEAVWEHRRDLLFLARPHTPLSSFGVGELALEGSWVLATATAKGVDENPIGFTNVKPIELLPSAPPSPSTSGMWLPDWRTVLVSFAAGMLFLGLLLLQWREWSRRRALAPPARCELTG